MRASFVVAAAAACVIAAAASAAPQTAKKKPQASRPSAAAVKSASAPRVEKAVPFRPGEVLTYDVSYAGTVSAGEATLTVREKRQSYNSTAYYIVAEGKPTGLLARVYTLYYKADTLLDAFTLLPQRGAIFSLEGKRSRLKTTMFNQSAKTGEYQVRTATVVDRSMTLAPETHDALSAIFALRSAPLRAGGKLTLPVTDSGKQYRVDAVVEARETVTAGGRTFAAWRVRPTITDERGQAQGRGLLIWISDDSRRLPLMMKAELPVGSFVLELTRVGG